MNNLIEQYKNSLSSLRRAMQNANNKIAQVKADNAKNEANNYTKTEINTLNGKIEMKVTKGELVSSINVEPQSVKINTSKLLLDGDAGNKCQNPSFNAGDSDWYGGITVVSGVGSEAQYWGRTLADTYHFYGDEFNVTVGDTMYIGCHCKTYSETGSFDLGLRIRTTIGEQYFTIDKAHTSDVTWIETKITIPNNAISARLYVYSKNGSRWDFSNVILRNAVNTELIVDGAIKAKHVEAEEFRGMFNGASEMSKLDYNSLEFVDGNNAKFASFKQDKLNLFNWNKGYIGSLTRSHMSSPETDKEGTVQLSGQYGYFHDFGYNTSLSNENYDISSTSYTPLMRIQYRQSNNASQGVHVMNYPLFVNSELNMLNKSLKLDGTNKNRIISENGIVKLGCQNQLILGQDTGHGIHQHFSYVTPNTSGFSSYGINIGCWLDMQWNTIWNANYANSYSDTSTRTYKETSMIEGIHKQIRIPIKANILNGSCKINIPNAFRGVMKDYIVTGLTKYGKGDIWIDEEYDTYFIVKADNDIKFALDLIINKH